MREKIGVADRIVEACDNVTINIETDFNEMWANVLSKAVDKYEALALDQTKEKKV